MKIPASTEPFLLGAAAGAIALAVIGFNWGGWITEAKAQQRASVLVDQSMVALLAPICVAQFQKAPKAEIVDDHDRVKALWCPQLAPYFPRGPEDPALALIVVQATRAEYWDESRTSAARYALEAVRAAVSDAPRPAGDASQHALCPAPAAAGLLQCVQSDPRCQCGPAAETPTADP